MNRFLKKECQDTEIPEQIYRQARNRAWAAIQAMPDEPRVGYRRIASGLAATLALILLVCVVVLKRDIPNLDQRTAGTSAVRSHTGPAALQAGATPGAAVGGRIKSVPGTVHLAKIQSRDTRRATTMRERLRKDRHNLVAARDAWEGMTKSEPRPLGSGPFESPLAYARGSKVSNRSFGSQKTEGSERIVLNFNLPTSGARMIWILDKNFHLDGGSE